MAHYTRSMAPTFGHMAPGSDTETEDSDIEMTDHMDGQVEELGNESTPGYDQPPQDDIPLEQDAATDGDPIHNTLEERMIIAIDFGTTFSSVAYTVIPRGTSPEDVDLHRIRCVENYPGYTPLPGVLDFRQDVPTELWYDDGSMTSRAQDFFDADGNDESGESSSSDDETAHETDDDNDDDTTFGQTSRSEERAFLLRKKMQTTPATQYWGYQVHQKLNLANIPRDEAQLLSRFKLNLDQREETSDVRDAIRPIVKSLVRRKIILKDTDIYKHFLTHLLNHTKDQLQATNSLRPDMYVQYVLCVPAKWPVRACRIMQTALEEAITEAGLSEREESSGQNLFIISEPEAAAECILAEEGSELYVSTESATFLDTRLRTQHSETRRLSLSMLGAEPLTRSPTDVTTVILCDCRRRS